MNERIRRVVINRIETDGAEDYYHVMQDGVKVKTFIDRGWDVGPSSAPMRAQAFARSLESKLLTEKQASEG